MGKIRGCISRGQSVSVALESRVLGTGRLMQIC